MSRHRRGRVGLFVRRSEYLELRRQYEELLADYRALEADNVLLIGDAEEAADPFPGRRMTPSWAQTEELPSVAHLHRGLDPDKATALVHRSGLLDSPSGEWEMPHPGTSG